MKVFVTGASGFIGTAFIPEILKAGHEVIGLARSDSAAAKVEALGSNIKILRGSLEDLDVLKSGAKEADAIVHLGFIHDFSNYEKSCVIDRKAILAILESIENTDKAFINTIATSTLTSERVATEEDKTSGTRGETEALALTYAKKGIRSMSVRLPPTVHGKGDLAFITSWINFSKKGGKSFYVGEGANVWPAVHRLDAIQVYKLALEKGVAGHSYHAIAEEGVKAKLIGETIGETLKLPTASISLEEAEKDLGMVGSLIAGNNPVSSEKTRAALGWKPVNLGLLEDIRTNYS